MSSIPGSGRSPGEGFGNTLQYSCLENPVDREASQAIVHRPTKSLQTSHPELRSQLRLVAQTLKFQSLHLEEPTLPQTQNLEIHSIISETYILNTESQIS